jgi:non-ribosomal peptide synthetase component F
VKLLEAVAGMPDIKVRQIDLLTDAERRQVVYGWNQTQRAFGGPSLIHERFEQQATAQPNGIAVSLSRAMRRDGEEYELSYAELERQQIN